MMRSTEIEYFPGLSAQAVQILLKQTSRCFFQEKSGRPPPVNPQQRHTSSPRGLLQGMRLVSKVMLIDVYPIAKLTGIPTVIRFDPMSIRYVTPP